jgi:hypothetical protein
VKFKNFNPVFLLAPRKSRFQPIFIPGHLRHWTVLKKVDPNHPIMIGINWNIRRKPAFRLLLVVFVLTVLIRLPNLNRPLSKHHEFIAATILINIESWRQAGGGAEFHFTPLMNYQHPGDLHADTGVHIDPKGNHLYLSLPPGWYVIPYFFFQVFNLPVQPASLRVINLLFDALTLICCFFFFEQLIPAGTDGRYFRILTACTLFQCSPGILWYLGNGYVHTAIMLPFIMTALMIMLPMLQSPQKITGRRMTAMALAIILLVYIDWYAVFLCLTAVVWALANSVRNKKYLLLALVTSTALAAGIALIFWQFASYAGAEKVATYWRLRFFFRSIPGSRSSFLAMLPYLPAHLITCYGPLFILLAVSLLVRLRKKAPLRLSQKEWLFFGVYGFSVLLYGIILIGWASAHEFSMLPAGLILAWLSARSIISPASSRITYGLILSCLLLSIAQYYFINRPGAISRDGMAFNTYEIFGEHLRGIPADNAIFANLPENCPMIEFYAGRNVYVFPDRESASQFMQQWHIKKAVWVESKGFQFCTIEQMSPAP